MSDDDEQQLQESETTPSETDEAEGDEAEGVGPDELEAEGKEGE